MAEYEIACPHCGAALITDNQWIGREIDCPGCSKKLTIPVNAETDPVRNAALKTVQMRCPHCQSLYKVKENLLGKTFECAVCSQRFVAEEVPVLTAAPAKPKAKPVQRIAVKRPAGEKKEKEAKGPSIIGPIIKIALLVLLVGALGVGGFIAYKHFTTATPESLEGNQLYLMTMKRANNEGAPGLTEIVNHDLLMVIDTKKYFYYKTCQFKKNCAYFRPSKENDLFAGTITMERNGKKFERPFYADRRRTYAEYFLPFTYEEHPEFIVQDGDLIFGIAVQIDKELQGWSYVSGKLEKENVLSCEISKGSEKKTISLKPSVVVGKDRIRRIWVEFPDKKK